MWLKSEVKEGYVTAASLRRRAGGMEDSGLIQDMDDLTMDDASEGRPPPGLGLQADPQPAGPRRSFSWEEELIRLVEQYPPEL